MRLREWLFGPSREAILLELLRVLDNTPPEEFSLKSWRTCLTGRAAQDPWFRQNTGIAKLFDEDGFCLLFAGLAIKPLGRCFKLSEPNTKALLGIGLGLWWEESEDIVEEVRLNLVRLMAGEPAVEYKTATACGATAVTE